MLPRTFSQRVKFFRTEAGLTTGQLATAMGVSAAAVSIWESGGSATQSNLIKLAGVLGVRVGLLLDGCSPDPSLDESADGNRPE